MHSFVILCLVSLLWMLLGYSLAFGPDVKGLIGSLDWIGLNGVGSRRMPSMAPTIPHQAFMMFQMMFAAITPALITGAFAERMKFGALLLFAGLWSLARLCAHCPLGLGRRMAGCTRRVGFCRRRSRAHLVRASAPWSAPWCWARVRAMAPTIWRRTICRWCCWEQDSCGSDGSASMRAARWAPMRRPWWRLSATHTAAATGALTWMAVEWCAPWNTDRAGNRERCRGGIGHGHAGSRLFGPLSAAVHRVSLLEGCPTSRSSRREGSATTIRWMWSGFTASPESFGILMTGLLASKAVNAAGADGLLYGNARFLCGAGADGGRRERLLGRCHIGYSQSRGSGWSDCG